MDLRDGQKTDGEQTRYQPCLETVFHNQLNVPGVSQRTHLFQLSRFHHG